MREPYTQLYVHIVWSTWDRQPILPSRVREAVYGCIKQECGSLKAELVAIGGTDDHVHVLVRIPTTVSVAVLVKQIKGSSSHMVTHCLKQIDGFKWQGAYAAFTVSKSAIPDVRAYILNQEQHHQEGTTCRELEVSWTNPGEPAGEPRGE